MFCSHWFAFKGLIPLPLPIQTKICQRWKPSVKHENLLYVHIPATLKLQEKDCKVLKILIFITFRIQVTAKRVTKFETVPHQLKKGFSRQTGIKIKVTFPPTTIKELLSQRK